MAITRRQFLKRACGAAAGSLLGPGLFGSPFVRRALAETIGDRYLVVLFLDGGNDGLSQSGAHVVQYKLPGVSRSVLLVSRREFLLVREQLQVVLGPDSHARAGVAARGGR